MTSIKPTKYLEIICGLFTGLLIISNICSNRLVALGPLEFDAGTFIFPLTYILGDLLTEVYGFARSRRVIWTGFAGMFLASL
ncbi:MAG: VUT family protein, partial [Deltaproteobacteria bacterium]|nr:VUT family protein [Deltaproteobacteria bacterium]